MQIIYKMKIDNLLEENDKLYFTLSDVNVSIANALRRIILSEIPCVVFKTLPFEENKVDISINTTRMNNELIKQRLSCIPIHISDTSIPIENYKIIIDKKNTSDVIEYITTEDIIIEDIDKNKTLDLQAIRSIFPKNSTTNFYIDIARLRPPLAKDIEGEHLKLTATLSLGMAKENGAYNVVSTCSYGNTPDVQKIEEEISKKVIEYEKMEYSEEKIEFLITDWRLLNSEMYNIHDSFDFVIETIGQFSNSDIIIKAVDIMLNKLNKFKEEIQTIEDIIVSSDTTLNNGYDITLLNEDYTLGKAVEFMLYSKYYNNTENKLLDFCGFRKPHPHSSDSLIRVGFIEALEKETLINIVMSCINDLEVIFKDISSYFKK